MTVYSPEKLTKRQLVEIIRIIDAMAPKADASCNELGITLGEAAYRVLLERETRKADR